MRTSLKSILILLAITGTACGGDDPPINGHDSTGGSGPTSSGTSAETGGGGGAGSGGDDGGRGGAGGGGGDGGRGGAGGGAACQTIAGPFGTELPHVSATGAKATAIAQALDEIFASQTPPIAPGTTYAISSLMCGNYVNILLPFGYGCYIDLTVDGGAPITIHEEQPSTRAQNLFDALEAAGAEPCAGIKVSPIVVAMNMTVSPGAVEYDDSSNLQVIPPPNLVVQGADAQRVIDAISAAGLQDCDRTRKLFIICNTIDTGAPSCGTTWLSVEPFGSSTLQSQQQCGPSPASAGPALTDAASLLVWQAILTAAENAGFEPDSGTLDQANVVNATFFQWDGASLGFQLVTGNATPPPPPPPPPGSPPPSQP